MLRRVTMPRRATMLPRTTRMALQAKAMRQKPSRPSIRASLLIMRNMLQRDTYRRGTLLRVMHLRTMLRRTTLPRHKAPAKSRRITGDRMTGPRMVGMRHKRPQLQHRSLLRPDHRVLQRQSSPYQQPHPRPVLWRCALTSRPLQGRLILLPNRVRDLRRLFSPCPRHPEANPYTRVPPQLTAPV